MNLVVEGDLAKKLFALLRKDRSLARTLAQQWAEAVEPAMLYPYLLNQDLVLDLLSQMLQKNPEKTLRDLQTLADGKAPKAARKTTRRKKAAPRKMAARAGRPRKARTKAKSRTRDKAKAKPTKRRKLTADEVKLAKEKVTGYLGKHPWATRRELAAAAGLSTPAIYRRIITELKEAGEIESKGEKSKMVYGLKAKNQKGRRQK